MTAQTQWLFGEKLLDLMSSLGLAWEVVESIPHDDLGSSPGDIYWTGDRFIIERTCPKMWVAHDIAHHLVQRVEDPDNLHKPNWGFNSASSSEEHERNAEWEGLAADLTLVILSRLRLPWHEAAIEMSVPYSVPALSRQEGPITPSQWKLVQEWCAERTANYLEGVL